MQSWARGTDCRRKRLLAYFGQPYPADNCHMCDRCTGAAAGPSGDDDLTAYARLFFNAIRQVTQQAGFGFGAAFIIDVLRGSKAQKVSQRRCDQLEVYAQGTALSAKDWRQLVDQFIDQGLLSVGEYSVLALTAAGQAVLDGAEVRGALPARTIARTASSTSSPIGEIDYDAVLFTRLRALRKEIADAAGLPPYVIFADRSLIEMAAIYPHTDAQLLAIHGVGEFKVAKYGPQFLPAIAAYCREHDIRPPGNAPHAPAPLPPKQASEQLPARTQEVAATFLAKQSLVGNRARTRHPAQDGGGPPVESRQGRPPAAHRHPAQFFAGLARRQ